MCGINAIYKLSDQAVDPEELRRMSSVIAHRGPDDAGYALLHHGRVGLASTRLSIIDLEAGHQPIYNEDHSVAVVFNGELYDYTRHRCALLASGHRFRTATDTEVLVHLYEEHGLAFLELLEGEYAFVLWDNARRRLIAARDRLGIKPLFYHLAPGEALFSSEVKGILSLNRFERRLSPDYLAGALMTLYSPTHSLIEGVRCLKPGCLLELGSDGAAHEERYWAPRFDVDPSLSFEEAKEEVRRHLERAVHRRMVADVPVGVYLSGGIDSTVVCGLMARHSARLRAFNIGFTDPLYDESGLAAETAEHYGVDFCSLRCPMDLLADGFEKTLLHGESIIVNPHSIAKQLLSRHVHDSGYKVCLTGEGGDEYFAGYPYFRLEQIWRNLGGRGPAAELGRQQYLDFCEREAPLEHAMWDRSDDWKSEESLFGYSSYCYHRALRGHRLLRELINAEAVGITEETSPRTMAERNWDLAYLRGLDPVNASRCLSLNQLQSYMIPVLGDRVEMANSVECRLPYLDHELVELTSRLAPEFVLRPEDLREKHVLREAFTSMLPPRVRKGQKHTFWSPGWDQLFRTPRGMELKEALLSPVEIRRSNVLRRSVAKAILLKYETLPPGAPERKELDIPVGYLLSIQMLHQLFIRDGIKGDASFPMRDRSPAARPEAGRGECFC